MVKSQTDNRIARTDLLFIGGLLLIGVVSLLAVQILMGRNGASVRITIDGDLYGTYPLAEEQEITVTAEHVTNILKISDGKAKMIQADCPDKLCMHQKAVSKQGETIVCLPNKIVVEIAGEESAEFDSISR